MTIVLDEKVVAYWQVELPLGVGNFVACLRDDASGPELTYRFRYYRDNLDYPHSQDQFSWYSVHPRAESGLSREESLKLLDRFVQEILATEFSDLEVYELRMGPRGIGEFMEKFQALPGIKVIGKAAPLCH